MHHGLFEYAKSAKPTEILEYMTSNSSRDGSEELLEVLPSF